MTKTKTVPIEPTDEMIDAGVLSNNTLEAMGEDYPSYQQSCINIYKAMLEAAPPVEDAIKNVTYSDGSPSREWEDGDNSGTKTKHKCAYWTDDSWCCMVGGCGCAQSENTILPTDDQEQAFQNIMDLIEKYTRTPNAYAVVIARLLAAHYGNPLHVVRPDNAEALAALINLSKIAELQFHHKREIDLEAIEEVADLEETIRHALTNQSIQGWMDISTAPKDGEHILAVYDDCVGEVKYHEEEDQWREVNNHPTDHWGYQIYPTHWMPLPSAPKDLKNED